jgi:hypothetical protein
VLIPLKKMWERVEIARQDSDTALFFHLMYTGEAVVKLVTAAMVAGIPDDTDRHRYRFSHRLVRADGVGDWTTTLDELLVGPAAQHVLEDARTEHRELTAKVSPGEWQHEAVVLLDKCLRAIDKQREGIPFKLDGKRWFQYFAELRNTTRAHGATSSAKCSQLSPLLESSIRLVTQHFSLFSREWAYLHRNLSGKYRVTKLVESAPAFDVLKSGKMPSEWGALQDGIYVLFDHPCHVQLIDSDPEASDFFFPNGRFSEKKFEQISYDTDTRRDGDSTKFLAPATSLPRSETQGLGRLELHESVFSNVPRTSAGYVKRKSLEEELIRRLVEEDRHPIVTLVGRGGIGKTALALAVLHEIERQDRFGAIVWLSARDIDLLPEGPKLVRPHVLSQLDIARELVHLMEPKERALKEFNALSYLSKSLFSSPIDSPLLFVFDNFETVRSPSELFVFLDTHVRLPNKILITTRSRDFKADFPVDVGGMTEDESEELIDLTSSSLGVRGLLTGEYRKQLIRDSDGHPYVIKILLGEVAKAKTLIKIERIVASKEKILDALFERTYSALSPAARQVFLTLCNWKSTVPRIAIEAVMLRPANDQMDVEEAIEELHRSSFIELVPVPNEDQDMITVPLAASVFGQRKLKVSPMKAAVQANTDLLLLFGAGQKSDIKHGVGARIERFFRNVADKAALDASIIESYLPMLEFIAQRYSTAWFLLARMYAESGIPDGVEKAKNYLRRYLENSTNIEDQRIMWDVLSRYCRSTEDWLGEIHALVELCSLPGTQPKTISNALNRWNGIFKQQTMYIAGDERQILGGKLLEIFETYSHSADATDLSRAAWLYVALHDESRARELVKQGLEMEPDNEYCQNLGAKLSVQIQIPN